MADIAPLTPLRYSPAAVAGGLAAVIAPPYDVIAPAERASLAARDPHNIVHLILPDGDGDAKYAEAARLLAEWRTDGTLTRDEQAAFYRHDQVFVPPGAPTGAATIRRRGFLALVRLVPFSDRVVLPHERTLSGPKEDRLRLFRATRTNLSPGFMLYRDTGGTLGPALDSADPLAQFRTDDGVQHVLAKVTRPDALEAIIQRIAKSTLLIADGHHRYETALRYASEASETPGARPDGEHRYFMTFLVNGDDPELVVFPTHRHVHSLGSFSFDDFVRRAASVFRVEALAPGADAETILASLARAKRSGPSVAAASADGRAAILTLPFDADVSGHSILSLAPDVLRKTDVVVLHSGILEPLLGITPEAQAAKTHIWYPQDARVALADLRSGRGNVLFLMSATPVSDVRAVAEAGYVMPQKSTFFYPKVPTGLALHTLDPTRPVPRVSRGST